MIFTRTQLLKTVLAAGMLASLAASGSAGAGVIRPIRVCCSRFICYLCLDDMALPEGVPGNAQGQAPLSALLALAEDRRGKATESPDEDFVGVPYAST